MNVFDLSLLTDHALMELNKAVTAEIDDRNQKLSTAFPLDNNEKAMIGEGRLVEAVKTYRLRTGTSLTLAVKKAHQYRDENMLL